MNIYKGTDRTAYVGERYTVKVARSNPKQFLKYSHHIKERYGLKVVGELWNKFDADVHQSLKSFLFHGIVANRRESRLAKQFGEVVVPTKSLLGGVVNLQRTSPQTGLDEETVHNAFVGTLGPRVIKLGHMLEDIDNLGLHNGQVKFVDGASRGLEKLLETRQTDVQKSLGSLASSASIT